MIADFCIYLSILPELLRNKVIIFLLTICVIIIGLLIIEKVLSKKRK